MHVRKAQFSLIGFFVICFIIIWGARLVYQNYRQPEYSIYIDHNMTTQKIEVVVEDQQKIEKHLADWEDNDLMISCWISMLPEKEDFEINLFGIQFNVWYQPNGVYLLYQNGWDALVMASKDFQEVQKYLYDWARE